MLDEWGSDIQVVNGELFRATELPGILAEQGDAGRRSDHLSLHAMTSARSRR